MILGLSYWIFPLFAACVWLATLLAMLITWITEGSPLYSSMESGQRIAYISDIGAQGLKPLFIAGSTVSVVVFDGVFIAERWLRHRGRLAQNTSWVQKGLSIGAILFALLGAAGLICLSILDTVHYPRTHDLCLGIFIIGYIISAIFICAEYQRLGIHYREHSVLRNSFWLKLAFIFIEIALAIAFVTVTNPNIAGVLEWVVSLLYIFYQASFVMDFLPAIHSKHHRFPNIEMGPNDVNGPSNSGGPVYAETYSNNSYASERPMQQAGGQYYSADAPPRGEGNIAPSRNF